MARKGDAERVSAREAAKRLGMTDQAVGQWANQAPADTYVLANGRRWLLWPQFPVWYRQRLQQHAKPANFDEAKARKMAAEAELAEIELAKARGDALALSDLEAVVARDYTKVRERLQALPGRLAPLVVGVKSVGEATKLIVPVVREVMQELSR
ncbi:MAG TPA: hypothetical protein VF167_09495 [Longimicrobiaceae bacterium]